MGDLLFDAAAGILTFSFPLPDGSSGGLQRIRSSRTAPRKLTKECASSKDGRHFPHNDVSGICAVQLQSFRRINQPKARAASNKVKEQWYYDYEPVGLLYRINRAEYSDVSKQELRNKRRETRQRMLGPLGGVGRCCFQLGTTASFMQGRQ